jgi:hypothetical protein
MSELLELPRQCLCGWQLPFGVTPHRAEDAHQCSESSIAPRTVVRLICPRCSQSHVFVQPHEIPNVDPSTARSLAATAPAPAPASADAERQRFTREALDRYEAMVTFVGGGSPTDRAQLEQVASLLLELGMKVLEAVARHVPDAPADVREEDLDMLGRAHALIFTGGRQALRLWRRRVELDKS